MAKELSDVSKTELEIMLVLWSDGAQTVRHIVEQIYERHTQSLHTTVKSLLERLMAKGFVEVDRSLPVHRFYAVVQKDQFVQYELNKLASSVFEGELAPLMMSLVSQSQLTAKDKATIQSLIDKL